MFLVVEPYKKIKDAEVTNKVGYNKKVIQECGLGEGCDQALTGLRGHVLTPTSH